LRAHPEVAQEIEQAVLAKHGIARAGSQPEAVEATPNGGGPQASRKRPPASSPSSTLDPPRA
jgi:hypothetical protein